MKHSEDYHGHPNYVATWAGLVALLGASLVAAWLNHKLLALGMIFGIAVVKAIMVAANFMHLKYEPRLVAGMVLFGLLCALFFFSGVYPDIVPVTLEVPR
ncbi:MAG: cytochrome C oxidase subunit IV family protein [Candidatus Eremiobacterota bacterium]